MDSAPATSPVNRVLRPDKLAFFGFQHVAAFYAGSVLVSLLIAQALHLTPQQTTILISADLFTCGIASLIQSVGIWKIGVRLPIVQGVAFACMAPIIKIGQNHGGGTSSLLYVYGSIIIAGIIFSLAAPLAHYLHRFFDPVVTGSLITIIGLTLVPEGIKDATRMPLTNPVPVVGPDGKVTLASNVINATHLPTLAYSLGTVFLIIIFQMFFRGFISSIAVLLAIVIMTFISYLAGDASFSQVNHSHWFALPHPFAFGLPHFTVLDIASILVVMLAIMMESTGTLYATGEIVGKKITGEDMTRLVSADGVSSIIGAIFNSFTYTAFAENTGILRLTKVLSRWVVAAAGVIMIILGLLPKSAAIVEAVPDPVLGGAGMYLFASVAIVGIHILARVDFSDQRNFIIVTTSIALALFVQFSQSSPPVTIMGADHTLTTLSPTMGIDHALPGLGSILLSSGITTGALVALVMNIIFYHLPSSFTSKIPAATKLPTQTVTPPQEQQPDESNNTTGATR